MTLEQAIEGMLDAQDKLSHRDIMVHPLAISDEVYRLGQYTAAVERHLGDIEEDYEQDWAFSYKEGLDRKLSATAAKQYADTEMADTKGQIKRLTHYVSSSWRVHTGAMARINHLRMSEVGAT